MSTEWKKVRLGDLATTIQPGPFGSQLHSSDYSDEGTPIIMPKDMIDGKVKLDSLARVPEKHLQRLVRHQVFDGDLMVARKGDVRKCIIITKDENGWLTGSDCLKVCLNKEKAFPKFIYYQLKSPFIGKWLETISIGATMPSINTTLLGSIELSLPPLETQQKIAGILSAYDDLIENNRKQIKLLEEAAQKLYKEWFVKLNFPGHENVKIVDGVPEGWKKEKLGNLLPIVTGKKDANYGTKDGKYPFFTCSQEPIKAPDFSFDANAILLAGNGDLNVKIYRGQFEAYQRTYVLVPYESKYLFICYRTIQDNLRKLVHGASGSTIKFITKGMIESIEVLIPHDDILKSYNDLSESILSKIEILQNQIQLLQSARDKLLPRLMNGGLEV